MIRGSILKRVLAAWMLFAGAMRGFQPDPAMLRRLFEEALAKRQAEYGLADAHTAQAARDLGLFLQRSGQTASARRVLAQAVRIDEAAFGTAAPQTLEDVASLAAASPPTQAEPLLRRAAESTDPVVSGPALSNLADLRKAAGDRAGAAAYLRKALTKAEAVEGRDSAIVALILSSLATDVLPAQGVGYLTRALEINRAKLGDSDPGTILTEVSLSRLLLAIGRVDDATAIARESLTGAERAFGRDQPATAVAASALAQAVQAKGDKAEAERLYRLALSIDQGAFGPRDSRTRKDARDLASLLRQTGKMSEAAALDRQFSAGPGRQ